MKLNFLKAPMQTLETAVSSFTKRGDRLVAKRIAAHLELEKAINARQQALVSGDLDDALDKLQGAVNNAESALKGIDDALALIDREKGEAERQLAAERDRAERAKVSAEINGVVKGIAARVEPTLSAMREIADHLMQLDHVSFEMGQLGQYLAGVAGEAEIALDFVMSDVRRSMTAVKDGRATIPRRPAPAEKLAAAQPEPPTMTVFMLRSAHYRDHNGRKRFGGQWEDVIMPAATARRALAKGIAVPVTDSRRAQLRGTRGGDFIPQAADVVDLDAVEKPSALKIEPSDPILREAGFTVLDRSAETRTGEITVMRF